MEVRYSALRLQARAGGQIAASSYRYWSVRIRTIAPGQAQAAQTQTRFETVKRRGENYGTTKRDENQQKRSRSRKNGNAAPRACTPQQARTKAVSLWPERDFQYAQEQGEERNLFPTAATGASHWPRDELKRDWCRLRNVRGNAEAWRLHP